MSVERVTMAELVADLAAETTDLDRLLAGIAPAAWDLQTPAEGWSIRDQVSHLAYFDVASVLALTEPTRFRREATTLMARGDDFPDLVAEDHRTLPVRVLEDWFRRERALLLEVLGATDGSSRMPWYGPEMSALSAATARLMETWAHGHDIADALGVARAPTPRLRHVARMGVRTRSFSYVVRGRPVPEQEVRVELAAPDGDTWSWGPSGVADRVLGPAEDFCLVVTQRRHVDDTGLIAVGSVATEWLDIAQAFAGAPGQGRPARGVRR